MAGYTYCPQCAAPLQPRLLYGRERAACPACGFIHFREPRLAVGALIVNEGRILLFRRAVQLSPRFEAAVVVNAQRWRGEHLLQLWTRPEHYGTHDLALIRWSLGVLQEFPRWPVNISLSTDHSSAQELVEYFGFRPQRTLLTLRARVGAE